MISVRSLFPISFFAGIVLLLAGCRSSCTTDKKTPPSSHPPPTEKNHPNIVLMMLDTLRPDYLGFYGAKKELAPFLAGIASQGTVFENAVSTSSWTAPAVSSIFTGLYPPQHTIVQGFRAQRAQAQQVNQEGSASFEVNQLPKSIPILPEILKSAGYRTFGYSANINIGEAIGFHRGFDKFEQQERASAEAIYENIVNWRETIVGTKKSASKDPFFLYLHFNDAHIPYNRREAYFKPARNRKGDPKARYKSEISYMDAYLKKIWELPGINENTVLFVVSDHGEEFFDHGGTEHGPTLYSELTHVVFLVHGMTDNIAVQRIAQNVSLLDVLPTLADLVQKDPPAPWEGVSLLPILTPKHDGRAILSGHLQNRCLFSHRMFSSIRHLFLWSIKCGHMKLIDWFGDRQKLFDHSTDRLEQSDLQQTQSQTAKTLLKRLNQFKQRMKKGQTPIQQTQITLDKALLQRLESLGYVE